MGKGRDKRRKHEDSAKVVERAARQAAKAQRGLKEGGAPGELSLEQEVLKFQRGAKRRSAPTLKLDVPPPSHRSHAVLAAHPVNHGEVILFGGEAMDGNVSHTFSDLYIYNLSKRSWTLVQSIGPPARSSAQGFIFRGCLFIFGGEICSKSQMQYHHYRDLWRWDARSLVWDEVRIGGGPSCRSGHRVSWWAKQKSAIMFGGFFDTLLEMRYYNDLWILSGLDGDTPQWSSVTTIPNAPEPAPRSGHCMAIHDDTLFVFGGYSTNRRDRLRPAESTIHHDLWTLGLGPSKEQLPCVWTHVKLRGIPPAVRCGVSCAVLGHKLVIFGGVVDVESTTGPAQSIASNEMHVLHLDSMRFFPAPLPVRKVQAREEGCNDSSEDETDAPTLIPAQGEALSSVQSVDGHTLPCPRMHTAMCAMGSSVVGYGGAVEINGREIVLGDMFVREMGRSRGYVIHQAHPIHVLPPSESDNESWVSGSTVVNADFDQLSEEEDGDNPNAVPRPEGASGDLTLVKGRHSLRALRLQLEAQLAGEAPVPIADEAFALFLKRTTPFWVASAAECLYGRPPTALSPSEAKRAGREAEAFARQRFDEAAAIIAQLQVLDERQRAEREELQKWREAQRNSTSSDEDSESNSE